VRLAITEIQIYESLHQLQEGPRIGPGRQLLGSLLLLDFVEISTCSAFSLPAAQRRKTLHKPTGLEEFRGMHWGYISIGEALIA
jgi:hypothetical protein